jgi:hypothetical protein
MVVVALARVGRQNSVLIIVGLLAAPRLLVSINPSQVLQLET